MKKEVRKQRRKVKKSNIYSPEIIPKEQRKFNEYNRRRKTIEY